MEGALPTSEQMEMGMEGLELVCVDRELEDRTSGRGAGGSSSAASWGGLVLEGISLAGCYRQ